MNYRITDLQCALGISQLDKLEKYVNERRKIAKKYLLSLSECKNFIFTKRVEPKLSCLSFISFADII